MLVLNRYQRRLLSRLRMNFPARERVLLNRAIDSLAMAGLVEYEASDFRSTKKNVNQYVYVWLSPIPNRIHYSVCEMCTNRNEELLNTVVQLEEDNALGIERCLDLQQRLDQLARENTALRSKLERQRQAHKRRDRDLSLMSASYKRKLAHLVHKFRCIKLKMDGTNLAYLVEANKNLQHNEALAAARIKELEQENIILQSKLEQRGIPFGELNWIASRTHKPLKESNMAKLDITVNELGAGDMCARGVSIIIDGISAEDAARVSLRFLSAIDPMEADDPETPQHVCTCYASDEDKRPPENEVHVIRHTGKTTGKRDNSFAPMNVE